MNQKNYGNKCFQHAATISLHYEKVGKKSAKNNVKLSPFINKYNWYGIHW